MHQAVKTYLSKIKDQFPSYFKNVSVLEIGSLNINGTVRDYFEDCDYLGIDLYPGKDVDLVTNIHDFNPNKRYDVVISSEALEHDSLWSLTLRKAYTLTKPGGLLIYTCANINRQEHGTTKNSPRCSPGTLYYYRNISKEDVLEILPDAIIEENDDQTDLYFYLCK